MKALQDCLGCGLLGVARISLVLILLLAAGSAAARDIAVVEVRLRGHESGEMAVVAERLGQLVALEAGLELLSPEVKRARFGGSMVVPPQHERVKRLEEIYAEVRRGDDLLYTDPSRAVPVLDTARRELIKILATPPVDDEVNERLFQTHMLLARSHIDSGNSTAAGEVIEDTIRQFGVRADVTDEYYHPNLVELYRQTSARLEHARSALLEVKSADEKEYEILLNRSLVLDSKGAPATTPYLLANLLPGSYHVQLRRSAEDVSKIHRIVIPDKGRATLTIDMDFDQALYSREDRFGLSFGDSSALRANLVDYASRVGEILEVSEVLVVGLLPVHRRSALSAARINVAERATIQTAEITVEPGLVQDSHYMEATQILCGLDAPPSQAAALLTADAPPPAPQPWYEDWIGWSLVGVGVVSIGGASYFLSDFFVNRDCATDPACATYRRRVAKADDAKTSRAVAGALYGVGGAAVTAGVLVFVLRDRTPAHSSTSARGPSRPGGLITPFAGADGGGLVFNARF